MRLRVDGDLTLNDCISLNWFHTLTSSYSRKGENKEYSYFDTVVTISNTLGTSGPLCVCKHVHMSMQILTNAHIHNSLTYTHLACTHMGEYTQI